MKLPTPRKLPSGSWFCRVAVDGESYSVTAATEKECLAEIALIKAGKGKKKKSSASMTLREGIDAYIAARQNPTLSASTIRGYRIIQKSRLPELMDMPMKKISEELLQERSSIMAANYSAKTVRNTISFICTVLQKYAGVHYDISTPQVIIPDGDFLQPEEVPLFMDAIYGTKHEASLLLLLHGLRASEVMNVQIKDFDLKRDLVHVRGAAVLDENNILVHQDANKNSMSRRDVPILIPRLKELIASSDLDPEDYIFQGSSSGILYHAVSRACEKAGISSVSPHDLRRTFASQSLESGVQEATCQRLGGWSDPVTMHRIYQKISDRNMSRSIAGLKDIYGQKCNEKCNEL